MLDATKEIVIALINSKQICNTNDYSINIKQVEDAIEAIYQQLMNTKLIQPESSKN